MDKSSSIYDKNHGKAIIKRPQLKPKYFKTDTAESLLLYKKQNDFCCKLYKKERSTIAA